MGSLTVVLDTNTIISAIGWGGKPWECLRLCLQDDVDFVGSDDTIGELHRVMGYEHLPFSDTERVLYPLFLAYAMRVVRPTKAVQAITADPDDDKFLEVALEANADCIVSGDTHLLDLGAFREVEIYSAREFLHRPEVNELRK